MFYLKQLVGGSTAFPYTLGQPHGTAFGRWTHFAGTGKEDGAEVSVFKISSSSAGDPKLTAARNSVKRLKSLRHPNVLAFKFTAEVEEKGETVIYLVTEPVKPLADVLDGLDLTDEARQEYVAMGLYHVARAVSFLNNDCSLIHGNLCLRAVVVTEQLDWRLHGFDFLSEHASVSGYDCPLRQAPSAVAPAYQPQEVGQQDWAALAQSPPWAVDAWGLGCLVQEAFSGRELSRTEDLRNLAPVPKPVQQDYQRLLASAPARRLNPAKLAEGGTLRNRTVETIAFLEALAVKDSGEKDAFFRRLPAVIPALPPPVAQRKLLPMLAGALEFGGAPAVALGALLQIGKGLEAGEFQRRVVPALSRLFASTDRSIRRSLLENIDSYGPHLDEAAVEGSVYPQVAGGFADSNAYLRELTLKSMLVLAPKLSQKTVNQSLLKHLAKLQVDEEAPIRANTTVLLGKLAPHLSEATRKRVLLNAFARALKDGFPPARAAGLKAVLATAHMHSAEEAAARVLPAVAPLAVDGVADVRHAALQALARFSTVLREHSATLDEAAAAAGAAAKELPAAAAASGGWSASLGSSLGWGPASASPPASQRPAPAEPAAARPEPAAAAQPPAAAPPPSDAGSGWDGGEDTDLSEQLARQSLGGSRAPSFGAASSAAADARASGSDDEWADLDRGPRRPLPAAAADRPRRAPAPGRGRGARGGRAGRPMKLAAQKLAPKPEPTFEF